MLKVYETLKKKNDTTVEVYPNIERTNIPDGAINTAKVEDKAVNFNKLNDALQDDITHLRGIYDAENDTLNIAELNVVDDIDCSNIDVSNKVTTNDLEVTNEILLNGDNVYPLFNHSLSFTLRERNDVNEYQFRIHITSSIKNHKMKF